MTASLIKLRAVSAGYPGRPVLAAVDLDLLPGERLALVGPNGAGKSTLFGVIAGLVPVASGTIEAFGRPRSREADFREVRTRAGLVFQDADDQLFCPTVIDDVAFGPLNLGQSQAEARRTAIATLDRLGLGNYADRVTHRLSGGEKRLVAIAAVLAMQPDVLLLDEPTTGLDEAAYARLLELLGALPQSMIVISHDLDFLARICTRAVTLRDGKLSSGTLHSHAHRHTHPHIHADGDGHHH